MSINDMQILAKGGRVVFDGEELTTDEARLLRHRLGAAIDEAAVQQQQVDNATTGPCK